MTAPLLSITDLVVEYPGRRRTSFRALHGVSLDVRPGETMGLVGESGSGKTTLGRAVLGLAPVSGGSITFDGADIGTATKQQRRRLSRDIQVVFQDPYTSLNPAMRVGDILAEPLLAQGIGRGDARARVAELLGQVNLPLDAADRFSGEFSGGQRQRVAIARALAIDPRLIVCDEPVSALDLTTQARVLELFAEIQERTGVAYLFVSHDLAVIRAISHRVAVMYRGRIVEQGSVADVTERPQDPYTRSLLLAAPVPDPGEQRERRLARLAASAAARVDDTTPSTDPMTAEAAR
ncbi:ATP-binding cassette domain-containing protein [Plantibacter sp. Mn2098]|uniref:ATP-binding cassette domain-containing protein n=1 Tax=Plantibacter sp. Mn2098 TaxID=3395266 RepID=UPI003BC844A0